MLKAEIQELAAQQEEQIEEMEAQQTQDAELIVRLQNTLDDAQKTIGMLQEQIATSEAVTAQPDSYPELRDYFEALLGALAPLRPMMPRAIAPAMEAFATSLKGRWPDENEVSRDRIKRVNALLDG